MPSIPRDFAYQPNLYYNPITGVPEYQQGEAGAAAVQLYAWQPSSLSLVALTVDASGNLAVTGGGGGGGSVTQGTVPWVVQQVVPASTTANAAASVTVTGSSTALLSSNAARKGAVFVNLGAVNVSFAVGSAAVYGAGITLLPGGVWDMDQFTFTTGAINAIAQSSTAAVAVQEFQ